MRTGGEGPRPSQSPSSWEQSGSWGRNFPSKALVGNREADSTRTTVALSGPGAHEQIRELMRSK
eukprot:8418856-Pyramimonas_sp.AAC.1